MTSLNQLLLQKRISLLDFHFGRFIERIARESNATNPEILGLTATLLSRERQKGNSCIKLTEMPYPFALDEEPIERTEPASDGESQLESPFPPIDKWRQLLLSAEMLVSDGGVVRPMVLDAEDRLYLYRYFRAEQTIAQKIGSMIEQTDSYSWSIDPDPEYVNLLFPPDKDDIINWQAVAALSALQNKLALIIGGPGTGKTATVVKILALLLKASPQLRIAMAAPTGKAAARLSESIRDGLRSLSILDADRSIIPSEVRTVHRLLGYRGANHAFRYHERERLPFDVIIVDEASMVDLLLLDALFTATPDQARLILLGDQNQLPSVDTGHTLWDICEAADLDRSYSAQFYSYCRELLGFEPRFSARTEAKGLSISKLAFDQVPKTDECVVTSLRDSVVELVKNHRFQPGSPLGDLARAVQRSDSDRALCLLQDSNKPTIRMISGQSALEAFSLTHHAVRKERDPCRSDPDCGASLHRVLEIYLSVVELTTEPVNLDGLVEMTVAKAFQRFHDARILCATRYGKYVVVQTTRAVEAWLLESEHGSKQDAFYPGRPVMVTANDYHINLFNGDIGICWPDENGRATVFFEANRSDGSSYLRRLPISRIPEHETAWAITIHKSQGSQFKHVVIFLPEEPSRILTRELIYTGITRASESVLLCAPPDIARLAIQSPTQRHSGLSALLQKSASTPNNR